MSAVDLPSCSDDDLVINVPKQPKVKTTSNVTHQEEEAPYTPAAGRSTQELLDFDVGRCEAIIPLTEVDSLMCLL